MITAYVAMALCVLVAFVLVWRSWWIRHRGRAVVVHTSDGQSLSGVLVRSWPAGLELRSARHEDAGVDLAGSVLVPHARVVFVQVR